jgi:ATP-binding cassette, subfamily G (WHITE), member 2, PDR
MELVDIKQNTSSSPHLGSVDVEPPRPRPGDIIDEQHDDVAESDRIHTLRDSVADFALDPHVLSWRNLMYSYNGEVLLKGCVSGYLEPHTMTCILGGPDAGQSVLLDVLASHRTDTNAERSGELLLDGEPLPRNYRQIAASVDKNDIHLPTMTVREALEFSARIRRGDASISEQADTGVSTSVTEAMIQKRVDAVLDTLRLTRAQHTIIGNAMIRGISGGERRRLTIGCESVSGHSILLADSPTDGLDSSTAFEVMQAFHSLTDLGLSVLCSIVQPSPELFRLFDKVIVMCRRSIIYFGPRDQLQPYFEEQGYVRPKGKTLSDWVEGISGDPRLYRTDNDPETDDIKMRHYALLVHYRDSENYKAVGDFLWDQADKDVATHYKHMHEAAAAASSLDSKADDPVPVPVPVPAVELAGEVEPLDKFSTTWWEQFTLCLDRQVKVQYRNSAIIGARVGQAIFFALLFGTVWYDLGNTNADAFTRLSLYLLFIVNPCFGYIMIIPVLFEQKNVYREQVANRYFRPSAFVLAMLVSEIPIGLLEAVIQLAIAYPMTGLRGSMFSDQYFIMALIIVFAVKMTCWCQLSAIAAISKAESVAAALAPMVLVMQMLFCGFMQPRDEILPALRVFYYLSMFTYPYRFLAMGELQGLQFKCAPSEFIAGSICPITTGQDQLDLFNLGDGNRWNYFWVIFVFFMFYGAVLYLAMKYLNVKTIETNVTPLRTGIGRSNNAAGNGDKHIDVSHADQNSVSSWSSQPLWIAFRNVSYSVPVPVRDASFCDRISGKGEQQKILLHDITAVARPGRLMALMGSSGAGKTTLLDVIGQKKTSGSATGDIFVNGIAMAEMAHKVGYVEQADSHLPTSTVFESVLFSANLRMPESTSSEKRLARVNAILETLDLWEVRHMRVGTTEDGLPPHLRKKLTIAVEMVIDPSILLLDEPTTGLDAAGAMNVIRSVQFVCQRDQRTVICTIHQPSEELFEMFDDMLLLQRGGRQVYHGAVDQMANYFESAGFEWDHDANAADVALQVLETVGPSAKKKASDRELDDSDDSSDKKGHERDAADMYADSKQCKEAASLVDSKIEEWQQASAKRDPDEQVYATSSLHQFAILAGRSWQHTWRDTVSLKARFGSVAFFSILIGLIFFQLEDTLVGGTSRFALLFLISVFLSFNSTMRIASLFEHRPILFRENTSFMYRILPYYFASWVADIVPMLIEGALVTVISTLMSGLRPEQMFLLYLGVIDLLDVANSFSAMMAALAPNPDLAFVSATSVLSLFFIFGSFMVPDDALPVGWSWAPVVSYLHYIYGYFLKNEFIGLDISCEPHELLCVDGSTPPNCNNGAPARCVYETGNEMLARYDMQGDSDKFTYLFVVIAFGLGFKLIQIIAMHTVRHIKR